jgi:hypothetical protein
MRLALSRNYPATGNWRQAACGWGRLRGKQPRGMSVPPTMKLIVQCAAAIAAVNPLPLGCSRPSQANGTNVPAHCSRPKRPSACRGWRQKSLTVMLAVANAMASHTGLASPLFAVDEHGGCLSRRLLRAETRTGGGWCEVGTIVRPGNALAAVSQGRQVSELQGRQGKKQKSFGNARGRRGFETERVAGCTA